MSTNSFFSVPREELLQYYPEIKANSRSQYNVGLKLAEEGNNGMAISHLLISSEEMIKALIVVLDAKGFRFRTVKGMDIFFRNHEIRFFLGYLIFITTLFADDLFAAFKKMKTNPAIVEDWKATYKDKPRFDLKAKWYFLKKFILIKREMKWFSKAEIFRQNGFYVDMKGDLISPLKLTSKEFNEAKLRIDKINTFTQETIDSFLSEDPKMLPEIEKVKQMFEKDDLYKKLEIDLEKRRKEKKSSFEMFNNSILSDVEGSLVDNKSNPQIDRIIEKYENKNKENE